jgi:protein-L-isoaspartate(D-aspartate) O-methyltransferase
MAITSAQFAALQVDMLMQLAGSSSDLDRFIGRPSFTPRVLSALASVPRHEYVPAELALRAYGTQALPIGFGKTTSQPFVVAVMLDLLQLDGADRVLEVGTGLGYQAALMSHMAEQVYTIEVIPGLAAEARTRLRRRKLDNVAVKEGDGRLGWPAHGPFDKILVTAASDLLSPHLLHQLKPGGRMIAPVGQPIRQQLCVVTKGEDGRIGINSTIPPVRFSRLTGGMEFYQG